MKSFGRNAEVFMHIKICANKYLHTLFRIQIFTSNFCTIKLDHLRISYVLNIENITAEVYKARLLCPIKI